MLGSMTEPVAIPGLAELDRARDALAEARLEDAVSGARAAIAAGFGRVEAEEILLEALVRLGRTDEAKTELARLSSGWLAGDPRATSLEDWDRRIALADRIDGKVLQASLLAARKKAAASGDFI
jgi:hypothetical protein